MTARLVRPRLVAAAGLTLAVLLGVTITSAAPAHAADGPLYLVVNGAYSEASTSKTVIAGTEVDALGFCAIAGEPYSVWVRSSSGAYVKTITGTTTPPGSYIGGMFLAPIMTGQLPGYGTYTLNAWCAWSSSGRGPSTITVRSRYSF